ncbi:MAG: sigma-70 family RNA polymerase sigma factor [Lentisphaeria bacterium]|nr:sigma-70 family RNA polymerase sigma factor [Lentisphaeria bacterium]
MDGAATERMNEWADRFLEYREQLLALARRNLNSVLSRRFSPEDVVQDTLSSACSKIDFFENRPDVPVYFKLRMLLFQTIKDLERKNLQAQKRDAYKDLPVAEGNDTATQAQLSWNQFADTMTGPVTQLARGDRYALLRKALEGLAENDRNILEMRHFDGLGNAECAQLLGIEPKAASIRYVRALERLRQKLAEYTEFRP